MLEAVVNFKALLLANEQRNAYGLRYNDYERYRKHCANRTHRLRASLKMTHGKGKEFKKLPPVKVESLRDGYLQLLLFEAERAWTYSREISAQAANPNNNEKASALRRNATSRFRRAVNWATQLLSHCQALYAVNRLSAEDLLQATIYTLTLNGRFLSSRFDYDSALVQLAVARSLLDELAVRAVTSRNQALATAFADEIGPEIRYCAHELGNAKAYDVDGIVSEISLENKNEIVDGCDGIVKKLEEENAGGAEAERKKLRPVLWEGEPIPVRNPELVDVLLRVQDAENKLQETPSEKPNTESRAPNGKKGKIGKGARSKKGVAAYDAVLHALSDAEEVARKLVETQQLSGGTSTNPTGARDVHFLHAYIVYQLLAHRIQRDLLLISTLLHQSQSSSHHPHNKGNVAGPSKPKKEHVDARLFPAVVKLLDTIIQSLTQMRTLSIVDDSPDLATAVDIRVAFTKGRRCRYLARCYTPVKKYAESLTLTQHGSIHLREARSILTLLPSSDGDPITTGDPAFYPLTVESIAQLENELSEDSLQCKKDWFAFNGGAADIEEGSLKAHKKPLFFDIALNYVQLDMERLQERAGKQVAPAAHAHAAAITAPVQKLKPAQTETQTLPGDRKTVASRAKVEDTIDRPQTPEPSASAGGGLSSLLGGWWGRK
ncbi:hypothetical protein QCA50_008474 [Cerrena zonata]|uniref:Signal recognition particle subunit SRP68 n=1 Tax=Cerrena zonata TaxID=2478898 RepID=A0AAW0GDA0_9APHY